MVTIPSYIAIVFPTTRNRSGSFGFSSTVSVGQNKSAQFQHNENLVFVLAVMLLMLTNKVNYRGLPYVFIGVD